MSICTHCCKEFDISNKPKGWMANHSRWCEFNPKRLEYVLNLQGNNNTKIMNNARKKSGITNQFTKAKIEGTPIPDGAWLGKIGPFDGRMHSTKTKQLMSEKALASPHRRLRRKLIEYNGVMLDSTWELELAIRLDSLNIKWIRPDPIKWVDGDNKIHNYFPDFYLVDHDIYLDPKNPQAIKVQQDKLKYLLTQYTNIVIIETLEQCKNFNIS